MIIERDRFNMASTHKRKVLRETEQMGTLRVRYDVAPGDTWQKGTRDDVESSQGIRGKEGEGAIPEFGNASAHTMRTSDPFNGSRVYIVTSLHGEMEFLSLMEARRFIRTLRKKDQRKATVDPVWKD